MLSASSIPLLHALEAMYEDLTLWQHAIDHLRGRKDLKGSTAHTNDGGRAGRPGASRLG